MYNKMKDVFSKASLVFRRKVEKVWLFYYLLIFIIPVIFSTLIYSQCFRVIVNQVEEISEQMVYREQKKINDLFLQCNNIYLSLFKNQNVKKLSQMKYGEEISQSFLSSMQQELSGFTLNENSKIDEVQLICNDIGFVISSKRAEPMHEFYLVEGEELFDMEFRESGALNAFYSGEFKKTNRGFAYFKTISFDEKRESSVLMIVSVSASELQRDMDFNDRNGIIFLLNRSNELIFKSADVDDGFISAVLDAGHGDKRIKAEGKLYLRHESLMNNTRYIYILPYETIEKPINNLKFLVFIIGIVAAFIAFISIKFVLKRNIRPVNDIISLLGSKEDGNEFEIIINAIQHRKIAELEMLEKLKTFQPVVMHNIVSDMVYTGIIDETIAKKLNIEFSKKNYYIVVVYVDDMGDIALNDNDYRFEDTQNLIFAAIVNVISEVLQPIGEVYAGMIDDEIVMVVNTGEDDRSVLTNLLGEAYTLLKKYLNIKAHIVSSKATTDLLDLPELYNNASASIEYMQIMSEYGVMPEIPSGTNPHYDEKQKDSIFISSIIKGSYNDAQKVIDEILEQGVLLQKDIAKYNIMELLMSATKAVAQNNVGLEMELVGDSKILRTIMNAKRIYDVKQSILEYIHLLCSYSYEQRQKNNETVEMVAKFVDENYSDNTLTVKSISDRFSMTPTYLSQKFKDRYGVNIFDYLGRTRIEASKNLLMTTKLSIDDIYEKCGFVSKTTFIRQFKKYTGITPGKLR